ncbi:MAG: gluconokinase [Gammaproteobacteria bacterium]
MVIIVMGVSGTGKTTVGKLLAEALGYAFAEGDDYHPPENVAKMRAGTALEDADRWPWLKAMAADIDRWLAEKRDVVLACSGLKRVYRDLLIGQRQGVRLVYLHGSRDLIASRLRGRHGHYMPTSLLDSQFAALEEPDPDEHAIVVDVEPPPADIAASVRARLSALGPDSENGR